MKKCGPRRMPAPGRKSQRICALRQLRVHGRELGDVDGDGAAAPLGLARAPDLEAGRVGELDQELRLPQRVLADPLDADLLDQVVARRRRVVRRERSACR